MKHSGVVAFQEIPPHTDMIVKLTRSSRGITKTKKETAERYFNNEK